MTQPAINVQQIATNLLNIPHEARPQYLQTIYPVLTDELASTLKEKADQLLSSNLPSLLAIGQLLLQIGELPHKFTFKALGLLTQANGYSIGLGQYQEAIALYDQAAIIYRQQSQPVEEARSKIGKIYALASLGRFAEALAEGQWATVILEKYQQWQLLGRLTMNLAIMEGRRGEDMAALTLLNRAQQLYAALPMATEIARTLAQIQQNRSIVLRNLGHFELSIAASQSAMAQHQQLQQFYGVARAQYSLAITYYLLGRYNESLTLLDEASQIFFAHDCRPDAARADLFTSDCLLRMGRFADVLDKCQKVRQIFDQVGSKFEVAQTILNEAIAYAGLALYDQSLASLTEAEQLFAAEGNDLWLNHVRLERAVLLLRQQQFTKCLQQATDCLTLFAKLQLPVQEALARLVMAQCLLAANRPQEAQALVEMILATVHLPTINFQAYQLLGNIAQQEADLATAFMAYKQAIEALEQLRGHLMVEFRANFLAERQTIYEDMVMVCLAQSRPEQGLHYAERAKSRALLDLLAYRLNLNLEAHHEADAPLVAELLRLRDQRDSLYRRWASPENFGERNLPKPDDDHQKVTQEVASIEKRITEQWHKLLIRNADYARQSTLWQIQSETIQPYLSPDVLLIEYFIAHNQLMVFVVDPHQTRVFQLGPLSAVQKLLQQLWLNLRTVPRLGSGRSKPLQLNAENILHRLYQILIAPIQSHLSNYSRLLIVPHGPLHYLPFQALHNGHHFLLYDYEISYLPSSSLLPYCQGPVPAGNNTLVIGYSNQGHLPHTIQEANQIAQHWPQTTLLLENQATLAALRAQIGQCRLVHLATHGQFRPDNPLFSGLVLQDGWLTTFDIFNLHLQTSLVTLSACQTGQNVISGGDELLGLMRAFLYAGSQSLLLSFWAVEDNSTAKLMQAFYQALQQGLAKGQALTHSQRLCAADPQTAHPYFWAPFFLVGHAGQL